MKIKIEVDNTNIIFSSYKKKVDKVNINNTNVIDTHNLIFSEDYIEKNKELIKSFLNLIIIKYSVNKFIIKTNDIAALAVDLLNPSVIEIVFLENKELDYTTSYKLLSNKYLVNIDCFGLPYVMLEKFDDIITTRCELVSFSEFMKYNEINSYSRLCNIDSIKIKGKLNRSDAEDIKFLIEQNHRIKRIFIEDYNYSNILNIAILLKKNHHDKVFIIIIDKTETEKILEDTNKFNQIEENYNVIIKIKYSKEYIKRNQSSELMLILIRYIFIFIIILGILFIIIEKVENKKENNTIKKTEEQINDIIESIAIEEITVQEENTLTKDPTINYYYNNIYSELKKINSETVGWLKINNTNINYPIVQSNNNEYYLNHSFDKTNSKAGWLFVDYRNNMDDLSDNTIIYGHNLANGHMFGTLRKLLDESWFNNEYNHIIEFSIKGINYKWQIFSVYYVDKTDDYLSTDLGYNFDSYVKRETDRSVKDFNVNVNYGDKILTLSTCHIDTMHRLVVHAKLIIE